MSRMLGQLTFSQGEQPHTAELDEQLHWRCDDPQIESFLNAAYPMVSTPLDIHQPAVHMIYQAAERLGAEVKLAPQLGVRSVALACA